MSNVYDTHYKARHYYHPRPQPEHNKYCFDDFDRVNATTHRRILADNPAPDHAKVVSQEIKPSRGPKFGDKKYGSKSERQQNQDIRSALRNVLVKMFDGDEAHVDAICLKHHLSPGWEKSVKPLSGADIRVVANAFKSTHLIIKENHSRVDELLDIELGRPRSKELYVNRALYPEMLGNKIPIVSGIVRGEVQAEMLAGVKLHLAVIPEETVRSMFKSALAFIAVRREGDDLRLATFAKFFYMKDVFKIIVDFMTLLTRNMYK